MAKLSKKLWAPLKPGDIVDVIAPGFLVTDDKLAAAIQFLKECGLVPRVPKDIFGPDIICANSDKARLNHLLKAFRAKDSKAIWCVRGGYGALRLIEDFSKLKKPKKNKLFIGYSDVTTIHNFMNQHWGFATLHGPLLDRLGQKTLPVEQSREILQVVFGQQSEVIFENLRPLNSPARTAKTIKAVIAGGNLAVTQTHLGTKFSKNPAGQILFFEDIGERAYKVDKMLKHLELAGYFKGVKAILFGDFFGCEENDGVNLVPEVLERFAKSIKIPVFSGIAVGHGQNQRPLPLGTLAKLNCGKSGRLTVAVPTGKK